MLAQNKMCKFIIAVTYLATCVLKKNIHAVPCINEAIKNILLFSFVRTIKFCKKLLNKNIVSFHINNHEADIVWKVCTYIRCV